jgi:hypothetical protein
MEGASSDRTVIISQFKKLMPPLREVLSWGWPKEGSVRKAIETKMQHLTLGIGPKEIREFITLPEESSPSPFVDKWSWKYVE